MNDEEIKSEIRKFALQNAVEHEGQTRDKTILAKIMGNVPELRQKAKEIGPIITEVVSEINQISLEEQQKEIEEKYPELLEVKKEKPQKESLLPALKNICSSNRLKSPQLHLQLLTILRETNEVVMKSK